MCWLSLVRNLSYCWIGKCGRLLGSSGLCLLVSVVCISLLSRLCIGMFLLVSIMGVYSRYLVMLVLCCVIVY